MNKAEAKELIRREVDGLRSKPYADLCKMISVEPITGERTGPSGEEYQIEIEAF